MAKKYGIVGGGLMGMTLAHRLAQQGNEVTIYEASAEMGGLAGAWKMNDIEWDKFYHVILLSDQYTRQILREIGVEDKINWVETKTGFYIGGKLYSMSNSLEFIRFPTLSLVDKFRLGLTILAASRIKDWRKLEGVPVTTWLQKWSGKNTYRKIWLPLLRAKLGESYHKTSAVFIWATIQRLYGARRSGLKKEMFGYVEGGYKTVIQAFKETLSREGVTMRTHAAVREVIRNDSGRLQVRLASAETETFDQVIVTLPSGMAARICTELSEPEKQKLAGVEYLGVVCVAVLLKEPISPYYVTNITDERIPFTGVIEMTALVDKAKLKGKNLVYLPKYVTEDDPFFYKSDEEILEYFKKHLRQMYPQISEDTIEFMGVARARHVITVARLNYSKFLPDVRTSTNGLFVINTSHIQDGTLNVNETIRVAETKLKEIIT